MLEPKQRNTEFEGNTSKLGSILKTSSAFGKSLASKVGSKVAATGAFKPFLISLVAIPLLIIVLLAAFPLGTFFKSKNELKSEQQKIQEAIQGEFNKVKDSTVVKASLLAHINTNYGCDGTVDDFKSVGDHLEYNTDSCEVTIYYAPQLDAMMNNIASYVQAVNGTISIYSNYGDPEDTENPNYDSSDFDNFEGELIKENEDGSYDVTNDVKKTVQKAMKEIQFAGSEEDIVSSVKDYASGFFSIDSNIKHWDGVGWSYEDETHEGVEGGTFKTVTITTEECYVATPNDPSHPDGYAPELPIACTVAGAYKITTTTTKTYGTLTLPIYYSLYNYKRAELTKAANNMIGEYACTTSMYDNINADKEKDETIACDSVTAPVLIEQTVKNYYDNYAVGINDDGYGDENSNTLVVQDKRNEIFSKLYAEGFSVPIYGISSSGADILFSADINSFEIIEGGNLFTFNGHEFNFNTGDSEALWSYLNAHHDGFSWYNQNGAYRQCTNIAHWMFYLYYGEDCGGGNGQEMVASTVKKYPNKFVISNAPAPGALMSIKAGVGGADATYGHVTFVMKVEGDDMWICDGGRSVGIRLNYKVKVSDYIKNGITYAVPIQ